ncbi:MAG: serine/threonine protein kinase [Gammaproteobacteria bacterium]|nr:serine/threonine protein kinase [Gammaproteobacteria bacterium]
MDHETDSAIPAAHPYARLDPDRILNAVEQCGYLCDGRLLALNSYENRVYQVGIEDGTPLIVKFYRPGRWSDQAILEEHSFAHELLEAEVPVVEPLADHRGATLHSFQGFRFALFPRQGGRAPALDDAAHLEQLGRYLARLHNVGAVRPFHHRPALTIEHFASASGEYLLTHDFIPHELVPAYRAIFEALVQAVTAIFAAVPATSLRLHGDLHPGNVLWRDGPHLVDLDDSCTGPAIQDLWMLLSGDRDYMQARLLDLISGYEEFRDFDARELYLVEALRTLRMLHYAAWLARRWDDPAFPQAFPWFNSPRYWEEHILTLREQRARLDEPPLVL